MNDAEELAYGDDDGGGGGGSSGREAEREGGEHEHEGRRGDASAGNSAAPLARLLEKPGADQVIAWYLPAPPPCAAPLPPLRSS
jgi:hypothetical protein